MASDDQMSQAEFVRALERACRWMRLANAIRICTVIGVFLIGMAIYVFEQRTGSLAAGRAGRDLNLLNAGVCALVLVVSAAASKFFQRAAALNDKETVGYLVEGAYSHHRQGREFCEGALTRVLPKISEEDGDLFDPYQRNLLYKLLNASPLAIMKRGKGQTEYRNTSLGLSAAVLGAVHRIGGAEAIPFVEHFEEEARKFDQPAWTKLADHARLMLADLRIRAARMIIEQRVAENRRQQPEHDALVEELRGGA